MVDKHLVNERAEAWVALRRKSSPATGRERLKGVFGPLDVGIHMKGNAEGKHWNSHEAHTRFKKRLIRARELERKSA